jgi:hypothetical protein
MTIPSGLKPFGSGIVSGKTASEAAFAATVPDTNRIARRPRLKRARKR